MHLKILIYTLNFVSKTGGNDYCSNETKSKEISDISNSRLRYEIEPVA